MKDDSDERLPGESRVGSVTLRVGDLAELVSYYERVVGLTCVERDRSKALLAPGPDAAPILRLAADPDASPRPAGAAGLFHLAILLPDRPALADALRRLRSEGASLTGASDHLVSEALYLRDPAGNGIELYRDRPREEWTETDDGIEIGTEPLDLEDLLAAGSGGPTDRIAPGTTMGHVHLEVTDLDRSEAFYRDEVGLREQARFPQARFLAAGDYHHHLGINTWNGRHEPADDHLGIDRFELVVPDRAALRGVAGRLGDHAGDVASGRITATDPDGIDVVLVTEASARAGIDR